MVDKKVSQEQYQRFLFGLYHKDELEVDASEIKGDFQKAIESQCYATETTYADMYREDTETNESVLNAELLQSFVSDTAMRLGLTPSEADDSFEAVVAEEVSDRAYEDLNVKAGDYGLNGKFYNPRPMYEWFNDGYSEIYGEPFDAKESQRQNQIINNLNALEDEAGGMVDISIEELSDFKKTTGYDNKQTDSQLYATPDNRDKPKTSKTGWDALMVDMSGVKNKMDNGIELSKSDIRAVKRSFERAAETHNRSVANDRIVNHVRVTDLDPLFEDYVDTDHRDIGLEDKPSDNDFDTSIGTKLDHLFDDDDVFDRVDRIVDVEMTEPVDDMDLSGQVSELNRLKSVINGGGSGTEPGHSQEDRDKLQSMMDGWSLDEDVLSKMSNSMRVQTVIGSINQGIKPMDTSVDSAFGHHMLDSMSRADVRKEDMLNEPEIFKSVVRQGALQTLIDRDVFVEAGGEDSVSNVIHGVWDVFDGDFGGENAEQFINNFESLYETPIDAYHMTLNELQAWHGGELYDGFNGSMMYRDVVEANTPEKLEALKEEHTRRIIDEVVGVDNEIDVEKHTTHEISESDDLDDEDDLEL